jgi:hypothetical protein
LVLNCQRRLSDSKFTFVLKTPERNSGSRVIYLGGAIAWDVAMPRRQINWKSEDVMAGLYLGIAVAGVNALVAMGVVIAFTGVGLF